MDAKKEVKLLGLVAMVYGVIYLMCWIKSIAINIGYHGKYYSLLHDTYTIFITSALIILLVSGFGMLYFKRWARFLILIAGIIGIILGSYAFLWGLIWTLGEGGSLASIGELAGFFVMIFVNIFLIRGVNKKAVREILK